MCGSGEHEARLIPFRCALLLRGMLCGHPARPRIACDAPSLATLWDDFINILGENKMKRHSLLLLALIMALFVVNARAEGGEGDGCPEGKATPLTKAEKAFYEK